jgi:hypothetical protein
MNQLRRFMYGRYGFDNYTRALIAVALILSLAAAVTRNGLLILISYVPILYAIFRTLSKNIAKRSQENLMYCNMTKGVKNRLKNIRLSLIGTKTHKYYRCPRCRQMIRVPRDKGKISISCPKCRTEFVKRT